MPRIETTPHFASLMRATRLSGFAELLERGAQVHAEFLPPADRHHGANDKHAAGALVEMRSRPDLAPGAAGDEILPLGVEGIPVGIGPIDPGIAQNLTAGLRAASVTLLVGHRFAPRLPSAVLG